MRGDPELLDTWVVYTFLLNEKAKESLANRTKVLESAERKWVSRSSIRTTLTSTSDPPFRKGEEESKEKGEESEEGGEKVERKGQRSGEGVVMLRETEMKSRPIPHTKRPVFSSMGFAFIDGAQAATEHLGDGVL